jgi:hypothetical protein
MQSHWRVFTNTNTVEGTLKLIEELQRRLLEHKLTNVLTEPYSKGGYVVSFDLFHIQEYWNDIVVDVINCAQNAGYEWSLSAFVQEEIDIISTKIMISGITMIHCSCTRLTTTQNLLSNNIL